MQDEGTVDELGVKCMFDLMISQQEPEPIFPPTEHLLNKETGGRVAKVEVTFLRCARCAMGLHEHIITIPRTTIP